MNIDENVPTIIPMINTSEKSTIIPVPKMNNATAAKKVVTLVNNVLDSVLLIE